MSEASNKGVRQVVCHWTRSGHHRRLVQLEDEAGGGVEPFICMPSLYSNEVFLSNAGFKRNETKRNAHRRLVSLGYSEPQMDPTSHVLSS